MRGLTKEEARCIRSSVAAFDGEFRVDVSDPELDVVERMVALGYLQAVTTAAPWCNCGLQHTAIVPTSAGREALRIYDCIALESAQ